MTSRPSRPLIAHLSMFSAEVLWGLMAPFGKHAMTHGISGVDMVAFRVTGAAILFWIASSFTKRERVPKRDLVLLFFAGLLGLVFNQCCYTIGLSLTSPINSSIVTTSMPIFAMILSAIILKEPITTKKAMGVLLGCSGAVILVVSSVSAGGKSGDIRGDLMCMGAQLSFALYLALFSRLIKRYSLFTVNKWMFTYATIIILPFASSSIAEIDYASLSTRVYLETVYVVCMGTFVAYILMMVGQQVLRPTVVSIYNYVQPVTSVAVSVATGIAIFQPLHAAAIVLVFSGVWLVTKSKSRRDLDNEKTIHDSSR